MFNFTPYYDPSHTSWEVVANIMSFFCKFRHHYKGCIPTAECILLPALTYPRLKLGYHWYNCYVEFPKSLPDTATRAMVLT